VNHSPPRFFWRACCCFALLRAGAFGEQTPATEPIPTWKDEIAKNYLPYHQLMLEDFPINDEAHPEMAYWMQPFVHYYYHYLSKVSPGGMIYINVTDWTVFSGFDKNLSARNSKFREMKMFLPYIQALLDISDLHARQLGALKAGELPSGEGKTFTQARAQLEDRVAALVQIRAWEAQKETDAFREATKNGQNQKKVRELAAAIKKRLAEIPSPNPPTEAITPSPSPSPRVSPRTR
jgi:hypothetical protein